MIKSDNGNVEIVGTGKQVSAEFCTLIVGMLTAGVDELILDSLYARAKDDVHKGTFDDEPKKPKKQNGIEIEIDAKNLKKQMEEENERNRKNKNI